MVLNNKVPSHIPLSPNPDGPQKLSELLDMDVTQVDRTDLDKQYAIKYNSNPAKRGRFWELVEVQGGGGTPATQVQSDWDEVDTNSPAYILNKPDIPSDSSDAITFDWNIEDETYSEFVARTGIESFKGRKDVYLRGDTNLSSGQMAVIDPGSYNMNGVRFIGKTDAVNEEFGIFGTIVIVMDGVTMNRVPDMESVLCIAMSTFCTYTKGYSKTVFDKSVLAIGLFETEDSAAVVVDPDSGLDDENKLFVQWYLSNSIVTAMDDDIVPIVHHKPSPYSMFMYTATEDSNVSGIVVEDGANVRADIDASSYASNQIDQIQLIDDSRRVGFSSASFQSNNVHDALEELVGGGSGGGGFDYVWNSDVTWSDFVDENIDRWTSNKNPINIYLNYKWSHLFHMNQPITEPGILDRISIYGYVTDLGGAPYANLFIETTMGFDLGGGNYTGVFKYLDKVHVRIENNIQAFRCKNFVAREYGDIDIEVSYGSSMFLLSEQDSFLKIKGNIRFNNNGSNGILINGTTHYSHAVEIGLDGGSITNGAFIGGHDMKIVISINSSATGLVSTNHPMFYGNIEINKLPIGRNIEYVEHVRDQKGYDTGTPSFEKLFFWSGTQAEYDAIDSAGDIRDDMVYYIIED